MILTDTFTGLTKRAEEWIEDQLANPNIKVRTIKREPTPDNWRRNIIKVTLEYEENVEGKTMSHAKKYNTLDELNEYFKTLNPNLEAQYNLNRGLSIKLYEQTLLGILPPNIDHVDHWWVAWSIKATGEKATADLLTDVMTVTGQLLDQFNQFGMDDDF